MSKPTSSKAALLREVRTELECPICRELFTEPKQLFCGHTYCHECLLRAANAECATEMRLRFGEPLTFQCPQCRQTHQGKVTDIGTNYILKEMVEKVKSLHEDNDDEPEPCSKCLKLTSLHELFLCNSCPSNSAQAIRKFCSLCIIQHHNGHTLKPYQDILMQKKLKDLSSRADEMQARFQASQKQLLNSIGLVGESLESFRQEIDKLQLPIVEAFREGKVSVSQSGQYFYENTDNKKPLDKEYTRSQLLSSRMEKFVTEMNAFVQRLMPFEEYANKFLKPDSENFDDFASEEMAFNNEIRQRAAHVHNQSSDLVATGSRFPSFTLHHPSWLYHTPYYSTSWRAEQINLSDDEDSSNTFGLYRPRSQVSVFSLPSGEEPSTNNNTQNEQSTEQQSGEESTFGIFSRSGRARAQTRTFRGGHHLAAAADGHFDIPVPAFALAYQENAPASGPIRYRGRAMQHGRGDRQFFPNRRPQFARRGGGGAGRACSSPRPQFARRGGGFTNSNESVGSSNSLIVLDGSQASNSNTTVPIGGGFGGGSRRGGRNHHQRGGSSRGGRGRGGAGRAESDTCSDMSIEGGASGSGWQLNE